MRHFLNFALTALMAVALGIVLWLFWPEPPSIAHEDACFAKDCPMRKGPPDRNLVPNTTR